MQPRSLALPLAHSMLVLLPSVPASRLVRLLTLVPVLLWCGVAGAQSPIGSGAVRPTGSAALQLLPQARSERGEGEAHHPGIFVLPGGATLQDAIAAAGGVITAAFLPVTEATRESIRIGPQEKHELALRDVETEFARAAVLQRASSPEEAASQSPRAASTTRLIERLRALRPIGRVVLEFSAATPCDQGSLPGDTIFVPEEIARATLLLRYTKDWTQVLPQSGPGMAGFKSPRLRRAA